MPFMAEQQKALIARGVPAENIHSEAFGNRWCSPLTHAIGIK